MKQWLCASCLLLGSGSSALSAEPLVGEWRGVFSCGQAKNIRMILDIKETASGQIEGVFEVQAGWNKVSYHVVGTSTPTGAFELKPGTWIHQLPGFRAVELQGQVISVGSGPPQIQGRPVGCKPGGFRATFQKPFKKPPPPLAQKVQDRKGTKWINAVRARTQDYVQKRVDEPSWWKMLETEVVTSYVDRTTKHALLEEITEARGSIRSAALLDELEAGPKDFPRGIGVALRIYGQAEKSNWPDDVKQRVYSACKKRVAEVLRPKLEEIAAVAAKIPPSLEGLAEARAAIAPVEDYRQSLEHAFGALDQENLLAPMVQRIAQLEAIPGIAIEFRSALATARSQAKPREATENVIFNVLGPRSTSSSLAAIAVEGRRLAALAEIKVESIAGDADRNEPSADDMAKYMYAVVEGFNDTFAAMRCSPGRYPPDEYVRCKFGELEVRLKRVVKTGCAVEVPGRQYVCNFDHYSRLVSFRTGEPVDSPDLSMRFPDGRLEGPKKVRFVRQASGEGWDGTRLPPG
ncbi:hypothetical protein LAC81_34690 (plasmid) [Ensifer adhaerens]|uniref:hypothetical protein n=1 Tax=Ensifer adhaerens TaxID=106592 RepID=UPI001CBAA80E|nr:hypothetical protein [Ensifer adhaerens]MBZ7927107.1 hypothetical protein [Ensifer adhaerens]UAX98149.1 hypothetical protein LAC78_35990 [Ensifer adhaerens]UAY05531.1 hypothetical protein LAC80_34695 [Ensifer adhaerens]UAY12909.1 hypothetical protein LAC81_34690 [Ensifer adhaerens]